MDYNNAIVALISSMGGALLLIVGFFLRYFYVSTNNFINEMREANSKVVTRIDMIVEDVVDIKQEQIYQNKWIAKVDNKVIRIQEKLGINGG